MSFNTSWGSSARQDHQSFMSGSSKPKSKDSAGSKQQLASSASISYAIGAPTSPSKHNSSTRLLPPNTSVSVEIPFPSEDSVRRYLLSSQKNEPRISKVKPSKAQKDTSVNIASAFHQATTTPVLAASSMPITGTLAAPGAIRRGPSVDRLAAPPPPGSRGKSPIELTEAHYSSQRTEESSGSRFTRAVSPLLESAGEVASRAARAVSPALAAAGSSLLSSATTLVRQQSSVTLREPRGGSMQSFSALGKGTESEGNSYDYAAEEAFANSLPSTSQSNGTNGKGPAKRKSLGKQLDEDRRAYQPPEDDSGSDVSDGGGTRRKKKSHIVQRHLLTGVPSQSRRRRRRGGPGGVSEDGSIISQDRDSMLEDPAGLNLPPRPAAQREDTSMTARSEAEVEGEIHLDGPSMDGFDTEAYQDQDLDQNSFEDDGFDDDYHDPHPKLSLSVGARLGRLANASMKLFLRTIGVLLIVLINTFSAAWELLVSRPGAILKDSWSVVRRALNPRTLTLAVLVAGIAYSLSGPSSTSPTPGVRRKTDWSEWIPGLGYKKKPAAYVPPDVPAETMEEFVDRLGRLEGAFSALEKAYRTSDGQWKERVPQLEQNTRAIDALGSRVDVIDRRLEGESIRAMKAEDADRTAAKKEIDRLQSLIKTVQTEVDALQATVSHQAHQRAAPDAKTTERIGSLEKQMKDVTDRLKQVIATSAKESSHQHPKLNVDGKNLEQLVNNIIGKDRVGMPDYALYFAGATVEPLMTSKSMLIGTSTWGTKQYARPPVTALVPDNTVGNCWPFAGVHGQLGVRLSKAIYPTHITIDHPARELLFDLRSAPKTFNVWGWIDGDDNIEKANTYAAEHVNTEIPGGVQSKEKPAGPWNLMHFGTFEYDVHSEVRSQTFALAPEIVKLRISTGGIVIEFTNNWGHLEHTCVYRVRAHGNQVQPASEAN